jgi:hypothetical protein
MANGMTLPWSADQIIAFAPDPSSAKAGRGLADLRHWTNLGRSSRALWGECQGSGKLPYQTQVDLSEPAFKCTCPSRKFPCKHGLGLLLLCEAQAVKFEEREPATWVAQWLASRDGRAIEKKKREESPAAAPDPEAQEQRAANRNAKVSSGLDDLERWLLDLVAQGIAPLSSKPYAFWDSRAARLVDAQAPGLARLVRELAGIAASGAGWPDRLLERLGILMLVIDAWRRIERLPEDVQADVRTLIGFATQAADLAALPGQPDRWFVVGRAIEQEDRVKVQRTWLLGEGSGRDALVLDFAVGNAALDASLAPGLVIEAAAVFYPGVSPARAILRDRRVTHVVSPTLPAGASVAAESQRYRETLAQRPWIERFPMRVGEVVPVRDGAQWWLRDAEGSELRLSSNKDQAWTVAAVSGGQPISVFGEWDGSLLEPLSVVSDGRFIALEAAL